MRSTYEHRQLCTIELIAEGHAERCPGEACAFWDRGCALERVESELGGRPEVAELLLNLRHELEAGRTVEIEQVHSRFAHLLNEEESFACPDMPPGLTPASMPEVATVCEDHRRTGS